MGKNQSIQSIAIFLMLVILSGTAAIAASSISFFVTDSKTAVYDLKAAVPLSVLLFKPYAARPHTECIYLQFDSESGHDFYCHLFFTDFSRFLTKYVIDYKFHYPDGTNRVFGAQFDLDQGSMSRDRFEWKIGPNWIKGDESMQRLHIESGSIRVDVKLKRLVPFYRVGDQGMLYLEPERKQFMQFTYFPLYSVEGTVLEGDTLINISGWGYGNHTLSNFNNTDLTSLHTALRWQKDGLGFDFHDYQAAPKYGGNSFGVLMVYNQGQLIHVNQNYTKEILEKVIEPKTGIQVPIGYRLTSKAQGVTVRIEFSGVRLTDYNDPLIWLGNIEKKLVQLVTDPPLDLRFDGRVKIIVTTDEATIVKEGPGHGLALVAQ